jgi:hypothetical protein
MPVAARRSSRLLAAVVAAAAVLAGCTTQSTPSSYNENVRADFVSGCRSVRQDAGDPEDEATELCTRVYEEITNEVPFEQFKDDNEELQDDPAALPDRYTEIVQRCEQVVAEPAADRPDRGCEATG